VTASIIDGKAISAKRRARVAERVLELKAQGVNPGLAVVIVGDDPASEVYVRNKEKACAETGIFSEKIEMSATTTQDVDGFHPESIGRLVVGKDTFVSCTPAGVMVLLEESGVDLNGKDVVVVGRSNNVGKPVGLLALAQHATVTFCHSRTTDLPSVVRRADVVIVAVGRPEMVKGDWLKPGAVVIDVGINRTDAGLVGDVEFSSASQVASAITPVPGGVGPMTIAMLLENTLIAAARAAHLS
jgi:methylenetetrahydrofolate dehydrogenase (NADP+)/methenyltetrahydrofolate cyclohydrolase